MSRTRHTAPPHVRALRRTHLLPAILDVSSGRVGKITNHQCSTRDSAVPPDFPRIERKKPRPGFFYPVDGREIRRFLSVVGPAETYGLKSITLAPAPKDSRRIMLAAYYAPGRLLLFDQALPPWMLPGRLRLLDEMRLLAVGALVARSGAGTFVSWPANTLSEFVLFDGLAHEIGHHMLQQYKGKHEARIARTSDHEAFARRFAERCRNIHAREAPTCRA